MAVFRQVSASRRGSALSQSQQKAAAAALRWEEGDWEGGGILFGSRADPASRHVPQSRTLPITQLNGYTGRVWMEEE